jgi:hypothetical protein
LASALDSAAGQVDPVPRPPFASHRSHGAGLVGAVKGAVARVLRPFTRFLFQRQAGLNRELVRTSELLAAQVRVLAERSNGQAEQAAAWSHDVRRAREERLLVLDALAVLSADLLRLEQSLDDLRRRLAGPTKP